MGTVAGVRRPTRRARDLRNAATPAERKLWSALSGSKLGVKFSRQMPVGDYICDFLSRSAMLAIELDGMSHEFSTERDRARDDFLAARGIRTLRFANSEVLGNVEGVVDAIRLLLRAHP